MHKPLQLVDTYILSTYVQAFLGNYVHILFLTLIIVLIVQFTECYLSSSCIPPASRSMYAYDCSTAWLRICLPSRLNSFPAVKRVTAVLLLSTRSTRTYVCILCNHAALYNAIAVYSSPIPSLPSISLLPLPPSLALLVKIRTAWADT